jgi:hypothetical protein
VNLGASAFVQDLNEEIIDETYVASWTKTSTGHFRDAIVVAIANAGGQIRQQNRINGAANHAIRQ